MKKSVIVTLIRSSVEYRKKCFFLLLELPVIKKMGKVFFYADVVFMYEMCKPF